MLNVLSKRRLLKLFQVESQLHGIIVIIFFYLDNLVFDGFDDSNEIFKNVLIS